MTDTAARWQRTKAILDDVLPLEPSEWPARINERCAGDERLRGDVLALLEHHRRAATFLETPCAMVLGAPEDLSGRVVGFYSIEARIGAGGMGEVYRAIDRKLDRPVALKLLSTSIGGNTERLRRFHQEARAASSLNHPHILVIHDFGDLDGRPFIVTEFVEGHTLRERLKDGPLAIREIVDLAVQVASALAAAHASGIVHRDIKPENIMVRPDGYAKVLDFGLAKVTLSASSPAAESNLRTEGGVIMGTPEYMSPEQARGQVVDFRSDQFSFGAMLYELATGRSPFKRGSLVETAAAVITDEPDSIDALRPDLPPPLRWAIERCLSKSPDGRYASTAELHQDLASVHQRIADLRAPAPALPASNLAITASPLFGRDDDAAAIQTLLGRADVRWVTLTGPGGVGKTRLALHAARQVADQFGDAAFLVPLANVTDASLVPSAIAQVLEVRAVGAESATTALERYLAQISSPLMLILDNFEHVTAAAVAVSALLDCCPHLKILVSSRTCLHVTAEHEYHVAPLVASAAVALFVERARATRADFAVTAENASTLAEICTTLDGLPLAIELAAARVKVLPPAALLSRLKGKRLSLTGGALDLPARQQALRATIDWGYELLSDAEQRLLRRLAVFVGGWTIESAEAVADAQEDLGVDAFDGISSLIDKSLIRRVHGDDSQPRFTMLETIREYGLERLDQAGDGAVTRQAHAAYCLVIAEEAGSVDATAQVKWLDFCSAEHPNLRAAFDYLIGTRQSNWAMRLASALVPFWQERAHLTEARARLAAALRLGSPESSALRARTTFLLGTIVHAMGDADALALLREALDGYRAIDDRRGMAVALNGVGVCLHAGQQYTAARESFEEAVALWRELGLDSAASRSLTNLASLAMEEGDIDRTVESYREVRKTSDRIGDVSAAAWAVNFEGQAEQARGREDIAARLYQDALMRFRTLGDGWGTSDCLVALGEIAGRNDEHSKCRDLLREAHGVFQQVGGVRGTIRLIETFARLAAHHGDASRALQLAGAAAAMRQSIRMPAARAQRQALDRALEAVRHQLTQEQAGAAWIHGWALSPDDALRYAFAEVD